MPSIEDMKSEEFKKLVEKRMKNKGEKIVIMNKKEEETETSEELIKEVVEKINESMINTPKIKLELPKKKKTFTDKTSGILKDISTVVVTLKNTHFAPPPATSRIFKTSVSSLEKYLGVNDSQAIIFASLFTMYFINGQKPVSFFEIPNFYQCNPLSVIQYKNQLFTLIEKNLIIEDSEQANFFSIPNFILNSIISNETIDFSIFEDDEEEISQNRSPLIEKEPEILNVIQKLSDDLKFSHFDTDERSDATRRISNYIGLDEYYAVLFAAIFVMYNEFGRQVSIHEICSFYRCNMLYAMKKRFDFNPLIEKGLIEKIDYSDDSYKIPEFVENAVLLNLPIPENTNDYQTKGILQSISAIVITLKRTNFNFTDTTFLKSHIEKLKDYLGVDDIPAIIFATMFTMYFDNTGRPISFFSSSDFYQCNPLNVLQYKDLLKILSDKGYIEETDSPDESYSMPFYKIPAIVVDSIVENKPIPANFEEKTLTIHTFIHQIEKLGDKRVDNGERIQKLYERIEQKEKQHKNVKTLDDVKNVLPKIDDRTILYDIAAGMINHINTEVDLMILVNRNTDESTNRQYILNTFMDETHVLFARELVQFENKASMMDSTISLTDKAFELLLGEEGKFYHKKVGDKQLKTSDKIQEKELFYMPENEKEIKKLYNSFEKANLRTLQKRLEERKLPKGICVIFYGEPGTGKTETVYQIAKKTGRSVFHVDIGNMRSQWYGETEQKFSKLFNDYRKMCESAVKNDELLPILLFNEADAIFGKRVENAQNGGRVDNTIQNILLEEMEKLQGIMIATTNLEENLDTAFERRFLFKIKFAKPNAQIKAKIWKSNMNYLTEEQTERLAKEFAFSGGEIANIVRKITMDEILTGEIPPFEEILEYCKTEKIQRGKSTMGFKN